MRHLLALCAAAALLSAAEPSVFAAGDLESDQPYGLTSTEKKIYQNSQEIKTLKKQLFDLRQRVNGLEEQVEGLKSVVEGIDESLNRLRRGEGGASGDVEAQIAALRADLNESIRIQQQNNAQFKQVLGEMGKMVDKIAADYVSKAELKRELDKIYALLKQERVSKKSGAQLFKEAKSAYAKKRYDEAKELFAAAAKKGYKPATSNFYIGESCYYTKDYACAVEHYKTSASLYQKASYMPTLLLHTAISLERLGQKDEAKKFYDSVIKLYPKSKSAQIAKERLKKL